MTDHSEHIEQYEHIDNPVDSMDGWVGFERFQYRVSWRIYQKNGRWFRDYIQCSDEHLAILQYIEELFGPRGEAWDFTYAYLYLFFRDVSDVTELKLRYKFPND